MKHKKLVIFLSILNIGAIFCLFLAYGPYKGFKTWFISTAGDSWTHGYLSHVLYSDKTISDLYSTFTVEINNEETKVDEILLSNDDTGIYKDEWEEKVLKRDEGNDLYKIFDVELKKSLAHVLVIYDPSRLSLVTSKKTGRGYERKFPKWYADNFGAAAVINASGFTESTGDMVNTLIVDGNILKDTGAEIIGINNENVLVLTKLGASEAVNNGIKYAVGFGPFLIVNGIKTKFNNGGGYGFRPRTAMGQRKDGTIIFVVTDGNPAGTRGTDMEELANLFEQLGCYNAANLDGGGSSTMYVNGEFINRPCGWGGYYTNGRSIPNAWILK